MRIGAKSEWIICYAIDNAGSENYFLIIIILLTIYQIICYPPPLTCLLSPFPTQHFLHYLQLQNPELTRNKISIKINDIDIRIVIMVDRIE